MRRTHNAELAADLTAVSQAGFDGDLEAGMMSWRKGCSATMATTEEVPRRAA